MSVTVADPRSGGIDRSIDALVDSLRLGSSRIPPRSLALLTAAVAHAEQLWRPVVQIDAAHRWYKRLHLASNVDVWLQGWAVSQETRLHDHGGSSGSFTVVEGSLVERYSARRPLRLSRRVLGTGEGASFGAAYVHVVGNEGPGPAVSLHAYSPPLASMTFYQQWSDGDLGAVETAATDSPEPTPPGQPASYSIDELLARARSHLVRLSPHEAATALAGGAVLVDIRPVEQRQAAGEIPGAVAIPRNVIEWRLDPRSASRISEIAAYDRHVIVFCMEGYASSLVARQLQFLGLSRATDLDGGFVAWREAGLPVVDYQGQT